MLFIIRFVFVLLSIMFCFLFFVFCAFVLSLLMYIAVSFLLVYEFTDHCQRMEAQLQLTSTVSYLAIVLRQKGETSTVGRRVIMCFVWIYFLTQSVSFHTQTGI